MSRRFSFDFSRREFIRGISFAPALLVPAPLHGLLRWRLNPVATPLTDADLRLQPRYPTKAPIDDVLRFVTPGLDEFVNEKQAWELIRMLDQWSTSLTRSVSDHVVIFGIDEAVRFASFTPAREDTVRKLYGIEVVRKTFGEASVVGRDRFTEELKGYFGTFSSLETAHFEITAIEELAPNAIQADIAYELVGTGKGSQREQRIGLWRTQWHKHQSKGWIAIDWHCEGETVSRSRAPLFSEVTKEALGGVESYEQQLRHGTDYWRAVLDGASGLNVYGNQGVALADFDGDGYDDLYVCQPSGLPNRLYKNRGDGTFEDVTSTAGVGVLDPTACALFADFNNNGLQDLLIVCDGGPLLFVNEGNGKFSRKPEAFKFERPPRGNFTHAAIADYDNDGYPDIYFCLYNYYLGLDQYHYPAPYYDARNGPPNFLMHNDGSGIFRDQTRAAGLHVDNDRYSFACAWGDMNGNGWPDLFVANDFGRCNLYRSNSDGTFTSISEEAGVEDVGAGMSACWCDFDGKGRQDVYVGNMWSAAGQRISAHKQFHENDPSAVRDLYRRHARGNSLFRNLGDGTFENVSQGAGVAQGRWSWSADAWDFDHDGYCDLYVTNGYVSGLNGPDLGSFFWRQVVARSPQNSSPSPNYELGWNAINELIRSNGSWAGYERNLLYWNNRNGTFSDLSGVAGLDLSDDGRAFALADLDHDGRLEIVLKNRTGPQLRIFRNTMAELGGSISFRLRGTRSNRDAIGAAVTLDVAEHRQTKYLQAGSGFLSQHSKELFFGLGEANTPIRATVRWPSGLVQSFDKLPTNHRIQIEEGSSAFRAVAFRNPLWKGKPAHATEKETLPANLETWLIDPLPAPQLVLTNHDGKTWNLAAWGSRPSLLTFWASGSAASLEQLRALRDRYARISSSGLRIAAIHVGETEPAKTLQPFAKEPLPFEVLLCTPEMASVYNIVYRYLFDLRRDLPLPVSFLVNEEGLIVKVYQGVLNTENLFSDVKSIPRNRDDRVAKALPFGGKLYQGEFHRNAFTLGVAFVHRGYLDEAAGSFRQVIAHDPDDAEAYYNLGTLNLRRNLLGEARTNLEHAVKLRANYPEAWNNLGMLAAQQGHADEAIENFQRSLSQRPDYGVALLNLGNFYRKQKRLDDAQRLLSRALQIEPNDPEANYSLGMFYAQQEQVERAQQFLENALRIRPTYADALNNLGVVFVREQRYSDAEEKFKACIQAAPNYDQAYLNLARLYVIMDRKESAREILQALLRKQPQHKLAQQALEMLN